MDLDILVTVDKIGQQSNELKKFLDSWSEMKKIKCCLVDILKYNFNAYGRQIKYQDNKVANTIKYYKLWYIFDGQISISDKNEI